MLVSFAKSVQGESHKRRENQTENVDIGRKFPCQDKSFAQSTLTANDGTKFDFIIVCDGHGGAPYFRSELGADFAIEVLKDMLIRNMSRISELGSNKEYEKIKTQLALGITKRWREKISLHLSENPITEQEYSFLEAEKPESVQKYKEGKDLFAVYGCTLIAYFAIKSFWFALQIGDGDFSLSYDGKTFELPMPEDKNCFLNQTTSLCDVNAKDEFRCCYGEIIPMAVFCSSDGVANSFKSETQLLKFYSSVFDLFNDSDFLQCQKLTCKNPSICDTECKKTLAINEIENYLPVLTKKGSGDDISLAGIIQLNEARCQAIKDCIRVYKLFKNCQRAEGKKLLSKSAMANYETAWYRCGEIVLRDAENATKLSDKIKFFENAKRCFEKALELGIPEAQTQIENINSEIQKINENQSSIENQIKDALKPVEVHFNEELGKLKDRLDSIPTVTNGSEL